VLRGRLALAGALIRPDITHGHSDHWIGLARLQERFPEARGMATREVVGRATFEPPTRACPQQYLRDFSRIVDEGGSVEDIVSAVLKLHGDRDNPRTLWHSARTAVAKRG
jgi:glyoxylase-like metal-dependent hydrolase (beta-lactamase superfamily II)